LSDDGGNNRDAFFDYIKSFFHDDDDPAEKLAEIMTRFK
jgi:hypothetical protein